MNTKKIKMFRFFDIFVYIAVILVAIILIFVGRIKSSDGEYYTVKVNDEETVYKLSDVCRLELDGNGYGLILVCDGERIFVESSECPDKYCVNSGSISSTGQMIVCVPAGFSVIIGESEEISDAVAG